MWPHAAIVIGAGVVGIVVVIAAAAYRSWEYQQQRNQYRREPLPLQPPAPRWPSGDNFLDDYRWRDTRASTLNRQRSMRGSWTSSVVPRVKQNRYRIVVLGPCGICQGDVNNITGFQLSCNHYMHHTCTVAITRPSRGHSTAFNWADLCRYCVISRINKDASMGPQNNEGLRNRGPNRQICADCRKNFVDDDKTCDLACNRHQVHTTCWDAMDAGGFTTCPMCMDEM